MSAEDREALRALVARSGRLLDESAFSDYVALYAPDGRYAITAKTPELPEPMTWMTLDRDELDALFGSLSSHEWDLGERLHLITVDEIEADGADDGMATLHATFCVLRLEPDGRQTLYASGRYTDRWQRAAGSWLLAAREARVFNRLWTTPSPIPL